MTGVRKKSHNRHQIVRQGILVSWESVFGVECSALHKCPLSVFDYLASTVLEGLSMGNSD